jgi:hypothetical protein
MVKETIDDIMYAVFNNAVREPGVKPGRNDPASICTSTGRSGDTILTRLSVNPVLTESAAADSPYNRTT